MKNKDLQAIGVSLEAMPQNYCSKKDKRQKRWKKQRKKYGFDEREVWNLDQTLLQFLYTRLKCFERTNIIDTKHEMIECEAYANLMGGEKVMSFHRLICSLLEDLEYLLRDDNPGHSKEYADTYERVLRALSENILRFWW